jgi:hypothetical protein
MCEAVVLHDRGVIYRDQPGLGLKTLHWVTALGHHPIHQTVCRHDGARRLVNEPFLNLTPVGFVPSSGGFGERLDVESVPLLLPVTKVGLSRAPIVALIYGAVVFRAKSLAQHRRPALPHLGRHEHRGDNDDDNGDQDPRPGSHRIPPVG